MFQLGIRSYSKKRHALEHERSLGVQSNGYEPIKRIFCIYDGTFFVCLELMPVAISVGVGPISMDSFDGCSKIEEIKILDEVATIGECVFAERNYRDPSESKNCYVHQEVAFPGCSNLKEC